MVGGPFVVLGGVGVGSGAGTGMPPMGNVDRLTRTDSSGDHGPTLTAVVGGTYPGGTHEQSGAEQIGHGPGGSRNALWT